MKVKFNYQNSSIQITNDKKYQQAREIIQSIYPELTNFQIMFKNSQLLKDQIIRDQKAYQTLIKSLKMEKILQFTIVKDSQKSQRKQQLHLSKKEGQSQQQLKYKIENDKKESQNDIQQQKSQQDQDNQQQQEQENQDQDIQQQQNKYNQQQMQQKQQQMESVKKKKNNKLNNIKKIRLEMNRKISQLIELKIKQIMPSIVQLVTNRIKSQQVRQKQCKKQPQEQYKNNNVELITEQTKKSVNQLSKLIVKLTKEVSKDTNNKNKQSRGNKTESVSYKDQKSFKKCQKLSMFFGKKPLFFQKFVNQNKQKTISQLKQLYAQQNNISLQFLTKEKNQLKMAKLGQFFDKQKDRYRGVVERNQKAGFDTLLKIIKEQGIDNFQDPKYQPMRIKRLQLSKEKPQKPAIIQDQWIKLPY